MDKVCIVFKRTQVGDEGVSVIHFDNDKLSVQDALKALPPGVSTYEVVKVSELPARDEYRNSWDLDNVEKKVKYNLNKAKEIHKEKLRKLREPKLAALDIEYQKADEADDKNEKKKIAAKKQKLRDITDDESIASAQTIEQLKAAIPDVLKD